MKLYFAPMACSLASRITLYEAGLEATYVQLDRVTKRLTDGGADYHEIHPLGLIPTLETDDGERLTENAVVLRYLARLAPERDLAPDDLELDRWLSFLASELHTAIFRPIFGVGVPAEVTAYALERADRPLRHVERHLSGREFLLDDFTIADALLFVMITWLRASPLELGDYPALAAYHARLTKRESVARAFADELPLYLATQAA